VKPGGGERTPPARRAAAAPDDAPGPRRWARPLHHGIRALLLLASAVAVYLLFPGAQVSDTVVLERGVVAPEDVVAELSFPVPKPQEELRRERGEAAAGVPPVLDADPSATAAVLAGLDLLFAAVDSAAAAAAAPPAPTPAPRPAPPRPDARRAAVRGVLERDRVPVTAGAVEVLADPARRALVRDATRRAVAEVLPRGVAASSPRRSGASAVRVRGGGGERLASADSVLTPDELYAAAARALPAEAGADAAELQRLLLIRHFRPSLLPNPVETDAARRRAMDAVDPVKATVLAGEKVVGAREQIGAREEERLRAYQAALETRRARAEGSQTAGRAAGAVLYNALLLAILGLVLRLSRSALYDSDRAVVFLAALVGLVAAAAAVVTRAELPPELVPVPFAVLVVAVLWGGRVALAFALVVALLIGGQPPFVGMSVQFSLAVAGAAAAFGVRLAERRLQAWAVMLLVAGASILAVVALGLLRSRGIEEVAWSALFAAVNAAGSSLLAVGFLPLAEYLTRVTTNQTLMELADPKHPLLRRLALEAPGTYAHTISVANLAEGVCAAIGANALLARVGTYYHDVGKVTKPQYFVENQPRGRNPHDKLKPSMSAAIVRSHVAEGLKLADEARLPPSVRAFIPEHHGTQPISFFLDQARAADPDGRVNPADFTYAGPRPRSRETAVVMLADSVESAARALADPTPERIRELVERIVGAKVAAGQLDDAPLTLRELTVAKEHLAKGLMGMYHHRVDYPAPPPAAPPEPATAGAPSRTA
jgi:putative nucleotidyltransferase with HDIG domain